jgi:hypothetical protein
MDSGLQGAAVGGTGIKKPMLKIQTLKKGEMKNERRCCGERNNVVYVYFNLMNFRSLHKLAFLSL